jgi:hypothetical protein
MVESYRSVEADNKVVPTILVLQRQAKVCKPDQNDEIRNHGCTNRPERTAAKMPTRKTALSKLRPGHGFQFHGRWSVHHPVAPAATGI